MNYENLKKRYRLLEDEVFTALAELIIKSDRYSKHMNATCIGVNHGIYTELIFHDNKLLFLDDDGYDYNLDCNCTLEDLINILIEF